jgi:RNA polymerase-binding transcription factor DksA
MVLTRQDISVRERRRLLEEQKRLAGELERLRESLKVEVDVDAEEGDPDLIEREKNVALVSQLEGRVSRVQRALRQIEKGSTAFASGAARRFRPSGWRCGRMSPTA